MNTKRFTIFFVLAGIATIFISANFFGQEEWMIKEGKKRKEVKDTVKWLSFEEALKKNKQNPRKIFIDVYTDWCGWCKRMDKKTLQHPEVAKLLNEKYYPVKFNAEQKEAIKFDGQVFKFVPQGRNGYHELAAALLNHKMSYPTVVFLDEKFQMITPVSGYQQPENLYPILEFIGNEHYEKMD